MQRSLAILLGLLAVGAAVLAGSHFLAKRICVNQMANPADDLTWLRQEFHLSDAELAHVRQLHEGYLPKCGEMCRQIAAKKRELEAALSTTTNLNDLKVGAGRKLSELAQLRAQCQLQMLQHFMEVSRAMPEEQGRRYLAEMQRLTLGFHEQIEQSMSDHAGHVHGYE